MGGVGVGSSSDEPVEAALVLALCRLRYTLEHGAVVSKRAAAEWALDALAPEWRPLIRAALDDRPNPWERAHQQASADDAERTRAFVLYSSSSRS
jgi:hypothetical protein